MHNPSRRNRHIGTSRQGHGKNNQLTIPAPAQVCKVFFERLGKYEKIDQQINGHAFTFVIEQTRKGCFHACTPEDVAGMIELIPPGDYGDLHLIIFRQPSRKEEKLDPVWGRMVYSYEFEDRFEPAIILEAFNQKKILKKRRSLGVEERKELQRLIEDGHPFSEHKRGYQAPLLIENVKSTQLYRTLPHEFGHYAHYLREVGQIGEEEDSALWQDRLDRYFHLPYQTHEHFAHRYAEQLLDHLRSLGKLP